MKNNGQNLNDECILVFQTTHRTLQAENILKREKVKIKIVLKPRSIATDCGLAIRFSREDQVNISRILKDNNLLLAGIYIKNGEEWIKL